ncbi:hypothetical protein AL035_16950 [Salipiger aestuarii]|uniref:Cell pole-organizing protein PopZ n=1 Tax=Salipiger aestuarii TaxID=568098 RepID=A0A327XST7_9RHOB|nr:hypothetical protein [Salipiger aestuarii]KAB2540556.1 hypothetical protein AL035_16950 [Salipiger aestuarii]RAK11016.1 hypothetical protein ATI53_105226 [Salipiger aestuarii]
MSDPVTNLEIEDVLSSIRRLVSEDARPRSKALTRRVDEKPDRLVLTPAQRVVSAPESESAESNHRAGDVRPDAAADVADARFLHAKESPGDEDPGTVDAPRQDISGPDDTRDRSTFIGRLVSEEMQRMLSSEQEDAPQDLATPPTGAAAGKPVGVEPPQPGPADENSLVAKIAALEGLIASRSDDSAPKPEDDGETASFVHRAVESMNWEDHGGNDASAIPPDLGRVAASCDENSTQDALVLGGPPWRGSHTPDETVAKHDAQPVAMQAASPQGSAMAAIDPAMLRGLVSDIVRQELQGALGERITRNVRKLVRREIHRMLVSQELE